MRYFWVFGFSCLLFWVGTGSRVERLPDADGGRVVVPAELVMILFGGDRYLAANLEAIRLASSGLSSEGADGEYLVRAHYQIARLNACHEDNYYLANGLLTWSGYVSEGNSVLKSAMKCRFWDGVPGFFYGVNKAFFENDIDSAEVVLRETASRWGENKAAILKLAVMLRVGTFSDEQVALNYLIGQRDSTFDLKLRYILDKRVSRLRGLVGLRAAQRRYEKKNGSLRVLKDLVDSGELANIPVDPLGFGYELKNGRIELKSPQVQGLERK